MYHLARRFDDAIAESRRVLAFEPRFPIAHSRVGEALLALGRPAESIESFRRAFDTSGQSPDMLALLGHAQGRTGNRAEGRQTLETLMNMRRSRYVSEYDIALVYAGLGDKPRAVEWLQKAYDGQAFTVPYLNVDPSIDSLRDETAFKELSRRIAEGRRLTAR
jgi:tetratricopeptide (TPR) repeat protein